MESITHSPGSLDARVQRVLDEFVEAARNSLDDHLVAIVLFGSGAEGRLRETSDVNVIVVISEMDRARLDRLRAVTQAARAAIRLDVMFLLEAELEAATEAFALKFSDIRHRHKVLYGTDPFLSLQINRAATIARLNQVALNIALRLRARYVADSLQESQLLAPILEVIGPLRAIAATLLRLEGTDVASPKEALIRVAREQPDPNRWTSLVDRLSTLRESPELASSEAPDLVFELLGLVERLRQRLRSVRE